MIGVRTAPEPASGKPTEIATATETARIPGSETRKGNWETKREKEE